MYGSDTVLFFSLGVIGLLALCYAIAWLSLATSTGIKTYKKEVIRLDELEDLKKHYRFKE